MVDMNYYLLEFDGVSCSGCVISIEQKINEKTDLNLLQISNADGTVVCSTEIKDKLFLDTFSSFKGCCDNCEIELNKAEILSDEEYKKIDFAKNTQDKLIKKQYKVALQKALNNKEVACSEHCVCKTTDIDRINEFQDAPSFASVYNLNEMIEEYVEPGLSIIDFGCGTGHDAFRMAPLISPGILYGIDITPEMIDHAKTISTKIGLENVQFTTGSDLSSVSDNSSDMIYTNNVFNILENKTEFIQSSYKKLQVGGKLVIADEFAIDYLPEEINSDPEYRCGGIAGAQTYDQITRKLKETGYSIDEIINVRNYEIKYNNTNYPMETSIIIAQKLS